MSEPTQLDRIASSLANIEAMLAYLIEHMEGEQEEGEASHVDPHRGL